MRKKTVGGKLPTHGVSATPTGSRCVMFFIPGVTLALLAHPGLTTASPPTGTGWGNGFAEVN